MHVIIERLKITMPQVPGFATRNGDIVLSSYSDTVANRR